MRLVVLLFLFVFSFAGCEGQEESKSNKDSTNKVYVTQFGEDYHCKGCEQMEGQGATTVMTSEEASEKGYHPCEFCNPPLPYTGCAGI